MARDSHLAIKELLDVVVELAEIVRDLDPSRTRQYALIEDKLMKARGYLTQAKAFERF